MNDRFCTICGEHVPASVAVEVESWAAPNFRKVTKYFHARCQPQPQPEQ